MIFWSILCRISYLVWFCILWNIFLEYLIKYKITALRISVKAAIVAASVSAAAATSGLGSKLIKGLRTKTRLPKFTTIHINAKFITSIRQETARRPNPFVALVFLSLGSLYRIMNIEWDRCCDWWAASAVRRARNPSSVRLRRGRCLKRIRRHHTFPFSTYNCTFHFYRKNLIFFSNVSKWRKVMEIDKPCWNMILCKTLKKEDAPVFRRTTHFSRKLR